MRQVEPHVLLDLHTTNGSYHGYHLTYATSLAPNVLPSLATFAFDELLPALRARLAARGVRAFDYGNFEGRGEQREWVTFDARPRFLTNYVGLRNALPLLCEACSCVRVTWQEVMPSAKRSSRCTRSPM